MDRWPKLSFENHEDYFCRDSLILTKEMRNKLKYGLKPKYKKQLNPLDKLVKLAAG